MSIFYAPNAVTSTSTKLPLEVARVQVAGVFTFILSVSSVFKYKNKKFYTISLISSFPYVSGIFPEPQGC